MTQEHFPPLGFEPLLVERLNRKIRASELWFDGLQSQNYVAGTSGFKIDTDGSTELNELTIVVGDIESGNWDGDSPADLTTVDGTATAGYYLDTSAGAAQFMGDIWAGSDVRTEGAFKAVNAITSENISYVSVSAGSPSSAIGFYDGSGTEYFEMVGNNTSPAMTIDNGDANEATNITISSTTVGKNSGAVTVNSAVTGGGQGNLALQGHTTAASASATLSSDGDVDLRSQTAIHLDAPYVRFEDGSAAAPSLTFDATGQQDVGLYRKGTDQIGFATGGVERGYWDSDGKLVAVGDIHVGDDLRFTGTSDTFIENTNGTNVLAINGDGWAWENNNITLPYRGSAAPSEVTTFASTAWITTPSTTITLWQHQGTNRTVTVAGWGRATWGETAAVAYTGEVKLQVSFDGGSTWNDGVASLSYVGTGTGGCGYRSNVSVLYQAEGTATGDVQIRMQHKVGNTSMDRLHLIHVVGQCEMIF